MVGKRKTVKDATENTVKQETNEKSDFDGYAIVFTIRQKNLDAILDMGHIAKYIVVGKNAYPMDSKAIKLAKSGDITVKYQSEGVYNPIVWFIQQGITVQKHPYPL